MIVRRWTRAFSSAESAVVIGNFDGVHRGHQAVIARLLQLAQENALLPTVVSFFPHPRAVVTGQTPPLLSPLRDRAFWLAHFGVKQWLLLPFTDALRQTPPEIFIRRYLQQALAARTVLVGDDFRFGYRGAGDVATLRAANDFSVETLPTVAADGERISSSAVRTALHAHELSRARQLLGHDLTFTAKVRHGDGRGRTLNARTANLHVPDCWCLPDGVYVVKMRAPLDDGKCEEFWGVANLGAAPTFAVARRRLETHLFAAAPALYGRMVQVAIHHYLRPEQKFPDAAALGAQIRADIQAAQAFIAAQPSSSQESYG